MLAVFASSRDEFGTIKMQILKCPKCSKYTMKAQCKECHAKTISPKPPRFSLEDPYGKYRLIHKKENVYKES